MNKMNIAEWIRQIFFPAPVVEGVGGLGLVYRERPSFSLEFGNLIVRTAIDLWVESRRRRQARRSAIALRACSDRTLRDLGIDRSEINSIVFFGGEGRRRGPADQI